MPLHLVEGPVGAGKSTYARTLAARTGGVHLALDAWFTRLYSPDRPAADVLPWYTERKARLLDALWDHALALHAAGLPPILELGLLRRAERDDAHERAALADIAVTVHVLDAPREVRRERVRRRNDERGPTFAMVVPDAIFELASDLWEPPDAVERHMRHILDVSPPTR